MKIKKAIFHQSSNDSPRLLYAQQFNQTIKYNHRYNLQNQLINPNTSQNTYNKSLQKIHSNNHQNKNAKRLLARILKKSIIQSPHAQSKKFYDSSVLTPQQVVARQSSQILNKNKSQILQTRKKVNKKLLQKIRTDQNHLCNQQNLSNIRYIKQQQKYNYSQKIQQQNSSRLEQSLNELIKSKKTRLNFSSDLKEQNELNKTKKQSNSFVTLTTIKQKIEKYLLEEEQKLKKLKNTNLYSQNHKLMLQQKANVKLKITDEKEKQKQRVEGGVFSSMYSLSRKKQSKHALDMMKRRLNFSMINKSMKERESLNKNKNNPASTKIKRLSPEQQQIRNNIVKNMITNKKNAMNNIFKNKDEQRASQTQSEIFQSLIDRKQELNQLQRQILFKLGYNIQRGSISPDFSSLKNSNPIQQVHNQQFHQNDSFPIQKLQSNLYSHKQIDEHTLNAKIIKTEEHQPHNKQKQTKNRQYLYNLYYYPSNVQQERNSTQIANQRQQEYNQKYVDWKKENQTQKRLKYLINNGSPPIDPIQCYYDSFINKQSSLSSINSIIANQKNHLVKYLSQSNSTSLSPLNKKYKKKSNQLKQKIQLQIQPIKLQQQVIFVNKKHKQNLQQKKLSNLLLKIQKRNSEIQKLGHIESVQILKSPKNQIKRKINGLNLSDYIQQQNLTLTKNKQKTLNNFIVQWPKNQNIKQRQPLKAIKKVSPKKKNNEDWTSFQPWRNENLNDQQLQTPYLNLLEATLQLQDQFRHT